MRCYMPWVVLLILPGGPSPPHFLEGAQGAGRGQEGETSTGPGRARGPAAGAALPAEPNQVRAMVFVF